MDFKTVNDFLSAGIGSNRFLQGMKPSYGFQFAWGPAAAENCHSHLNPLGCCPILGDCVARQLWHSKSGCLEVSVDYEPMPLFNALRYCGEIKNLGDSSIEYVKDISMVSFSFGLNAIGQPTIHGAGGGMYDSCYPPMTFRRYDVSPMAAVHGSIEFGSKLGFSSNETLPFFVVSDETSSCGLFIGLGWSGNWKAVFSISEDTAGNKCFNIMAEIPSIDTSLLPGESLPIPEVLIGYYNGAPIQGMNVLRRTIFAQYVPKLAGAEGFPPVGYGTWFANGGCRGAEQLNEELLKRQADIAEELGCEFFEIDLGWESGSEEIKAFDERKIDWEPAESKFPSGLEAFSHYVRSKGMQFGLWIDIARTTNSSWVAQEHPDWVLWQKGGSTVAGMVNFGLAQVREWAKSVIGNMVEKYSIRWLRMDYNLNPSQHWDNNDTEGRKGITETKHILGYYEFLDWVLEQYPELCIEQCAAGGRMLDLGTVRRGHMLFLSDMTASASICRYQLSGANCFLPAPVMDRNLADWAETYTDAQYLSRFGGAFGISDNILPWSRETIEKTSKMTVLYKSIRHYLAGDFYPLFPQPCSLRAWDGWQFHDPGSMSGVFMLFRSKSPEGRAQARLSALDQEIEYSIIDLLTGEKKTLYGRVLAIQGFEAVLEYDEAGIWEYKPA